VQDVQRKHRDLIDALGDADARLARLCELNVVEQVRNVCETTILREAWARGQAVTVHGCIYGLTDGRLKDLGLAASSWDECEAQTAAVTRA
jgi:carbonic anhydrase